MVEWQLDSLSRRDDDLRSGAEVTTPLRSPRTNTSLELGDVSVPFLRLRRRQVCKDGRAQNCWGNCETRRRRKRDEGRNNGSSSSSAYSFAVRPLSSATTVIIIIIMLYNEGPASLALRGPRVILGRVARSTWGEPRNLFRRSHSASPSLSSSSPSIDLGRFFVGRDKCTPDVEEAAARRRRSRFFIGSVGRDLLNFDGRRRHCRPEGARGERARDYMCVFLQFRRRFVSVLSPTLCVQPLSPILLLLHHHPDSLPGRCRRVPIAPGWDGWMDGWIDGREKKGTMTIFAFPNTVRGSHKSGGRAVSLSVERGWRRRWRPDYHPLLRIACAVLRPVFFAVAPSLRRMFNSVIRLTSVPHSNYAET